MHAMLKTRRMIFTMIHDIIDIEILEDDDGVPYEAEKIVKEDLKTPIYIELEDIRLIMPQFNKEGRRYNKRTVVKVNGDSIVLNHTFDELSKIKIKNKVIVGFKR